MIDVQYTLWGLMGLVFSIYTGVAEFIFHMPINAFVMSLAIMNSGFIMQIFIIIQSEKI